MLWAPVEEYPTTFVPAERGADTAPTWVPREPPGVYVEAPAGTGQAGAEQAQDRGRGDRADGQARPGACGHLGPMGRAAVGRGHACDIGMPLTTL